MNVLCKIVKYRKKLEIKNLTTTYYTYYIFKRKMFSTSLKCVWLPVLISDVNLYWIIMIIHVSIFSTKIIHSV
jgi:hypothetical protein